MRSLSLAAPGLALFLSACAAPPASLPFTPGMHEPEARHRHFMAQRVAPDEAYPLEHLHAELELIRAREQQMQAGGAVPASWTNIGPGNVGGRTRAIVFDPSDPDTMYAGGVAGGVFKSTDGGEQWSPTGDTLLNLAIASLAIDPNDPDVLYAGTGEGILPGRPGMRGLGIFKTVDGGATWAQLPGTVNGVPTGSFWYVNKVVISPHDSNRLYAATRFGVWRSLDAGATWSIVLGNPNYIATPASSNGSVIGCTELVVRPGSDPDVVWAAFGTQQADGLFRSDDGGSTWAAYTVPPNQGRMTIDLAPSNPDVMYILMADNGAGGQWGQLVQVFRSDDGGASFTAVVNLDAGFGPYLLGNVATWTGCVEFPPYSQGWYDNIIRVDPVDPDVVWVGGVDLFRSDDGGSTWGLAGYWFYYAQDPTPPSYIHADQHQIVFHPDYDGVTNRTMFVGNDGGIFRTLDARAATGQEACPIEGGGGGTQPQVPWTSMNHGYAVTQFYHGDSARDADVFVAGAQDNGTSRGLGTDAPNEWRIIFGGDGGYAAVDPTDEDTIYVSYQFLGNFLKSVDGGETFALANNGITDTAGVFIVPYVLDESNPQVLWTGGARPWRTTNGAALWTVAGPDFAGPQFITAIAAAPSDSDVVYLGFNNGFVARSTNALSAAPTWEVFENGLVGAWVSSVAVAPDDPDVAYITYSSFGVPHVLRTLDGGASWQSIDGIEAAGVPDIPAHWVAVRPCDPQQLFVGTELGVFASTDGGAAWQPANEGLAHTIVETLDFKDHHTLVAFTHGRSAFIAQLPPCASCPADLDGDGAVGVADLIEVVVAWGPCAGACPADITGDGVIDVTDLVLLITAWGECAPGD